MDVIRINGISYNTIISEITENFNILYSENTGRTLDNAKMILDPIGTFYGHRVTFLRKHGYEDEYDALFMELSKPVSDGIQLQIVHNQNTISYDAYVSQGERALKKIDPITKKVYWDRLSVNFIPMEAQVTSG